MIIFFYWKKTDDNWVVQFGFALKSHDPSQRANSIVTVAGGIKEILNQIMR